MHVLYRQEKSNKTEQGRRFFRTGTHQKWIPIASRDLQTAFSTILYVFYQHARRPTASERGERCEKEKKDHVTLVHFEVSASRFRSLFSNEMGKNNKNGIQNTQLLQEIFYASLFKLRFPTIGHFLENEDLSV